MDKWLREQSIGMAQSAHMRTPPPTRDDLATEYWRGYRKGYRRAMLLSAVLWAIILCFAVGVARADEDFPSPDAMTSRTFDPNFCNRPGCVRTNENVCRCP